MQTANPTPAAGATGSPDPVVADLATLLTATPGLRAKFFANPTEEVGRQLPPQKYWNYGTDEKQRQAERLRLAQAVLQEIARRITANELASTVNTDAVFQEFFAPIVRVSQQSFTSVFWLSWFAFGAGLILIGAGVYVAVKPPAGVNSTVTSSIFGGSGAISALGAVYAMAKQGIREATLDHAALRLILTSFATQLGQLRAVAETAPLDPQSDDSKRLSSVTAINVAIGQTLEQALKSIPGREQKDVSRDKSTE